MQKVSLDRLIDNAAASVEMEGFRIDEQSRIWCKQLLSNEITMDEYIIRIKQKAGVNV